MAGVAVRLICLALFAGAVFAYLGVLPAIKQQLLGKSSDFAEIVFADLPHQDILISFGGGPQDNPPDGCSIAVVSLNETAAPAPPRPDATRPKGYQFGGLWRKTPLPQTAPHFRDLLDTCRSSFDKNTLRSLREAMALPGAYVIRSWTGNELEIYAPEAVIAAKLRYGPPPKLSP